MTTSPQPVQRIFVSHSSKDNDFGVQLVEDLRRILGDESAVWYDAKRGLNPGDQWFQKIENEVIARDIFLIVLSPDAMNSAWVRREFDIALNEKKRIIPVLYRSYQVWPYLRTVHHVSYLPPGPTKQPLTNYLPRWVCHLMSSQRNLQVHPPTPQQPSCAR